MSDLKEVQYFYITFKYKGKKQGAVFSCDFVLPKDTSWHVLEKKAYGLFVEFMSCVFPLAVSSQITPPDEINIVEGHCFLVPANGVV